ncbi:MFS transporter [Microcoleus sp. FACHB-831]|uniref:MFS transporter n=1 Tax=Microcoleus sp. FACHB-831 TaxID=2692827 RepID=UPI0016889A16|nr:MFS transporter [Microcoleus sp. FACHB-831]MBD1919831.1 MFS transporter [Microcoleus sp. FACHB-831]
MFYNALFTLELSSKQFWMAQFPESQINPEEAALIFSGPQFFVALVAGVVMAFAFQLLLTNLSIAAGISAGDDVLEADVDDDDESVTWGKKVRKIEAKVGLWTIFTVNIALSIACFLAVKLSLISSPGLGAIIGVTIWSAFFLLLAWAGSNAVGSFIGSAIKTATSGMQGVMATAGAALGANAANAQIVNTVEASVAAVRRELTSGLDPSSIRDTVEDYVGNLQLPKLDLKDIRGNFEKLLNEPDVKALAGSDILSNINRQTFVDLVSRRTDFSKQDIDRVVDQLEGAWKQVVNKQPQQVMAEGRDNVDAAQPQEIIASLGKQLDETRGESGERDKQPGLMERAMQYGTTALVGSALKNVNLSDVDVEKVSGQLKQLGSKVVENLPSLQSNPILSDVENYLQNSQPWHLNRETIKQEFKDVIYDPEAAPGFVRPLLEQVNRDSFVQLLNKRGDFSEERVNEIADQLEGIRTEILETVGGAESQEKSQDLRSRIENYLRSTGKEELNPEGIERDFKTLLEDREAGFEALRDRISQFDRDSLVQVLGQREDFSPEEADQLIGKLEETRDRVLSQAQELQEQAKSKTQELRQKVEAYLRDTNKEELNPEGIKRDFQTLIDDPQAGLTVLRDRLSQVDRDTLVQLLTARGDLSEEQINQTISQIESVRDNIMQAPQQVADKAKEQYEKVTTTIGEYLRNTNLEELNPEGIQRDFAKLFDDPKEGALALRQRLSQVDRETLVKLLSQRQDLSEEQVNKIVDSVQENISSVIKAPRRLASRAKDKVQDLQANLESYLRNTNKEELNPDAIKRDLQLLFKDPRAGFGSLGDRLKQFDRSTLVSFLSQREDISEEEANHIADQIESVRNQLVEQVENVKNRVKSVNDSINATIENYLNSLERPELNYEGIKRDFRKLFDDPQAGGEALKERLSHFDRDTLVAVLSSRKDISEADANRIIDQIEAARDSVMNRAERLQEQAKQRIKDIKRNAKKQAEETRKSAATAAWWIFGTALTSVAASAIAGAIAVSGISGITGGF